MPSITINGNEIQAAEGTTIFTAAQANGVYIPGLCSHPDLPAGGVCGLCLVEVEGMEEPVKACTTEVAEGMVVVTESEVIKKQRQAALKDILATHPHACLTCAQREGCSRTQCSSNVKETERCCPRLGNCEVQKVSEYIGIPEDTPKFVYRELPVITEEPLIERNYNYCIGCTRCVRACEKLRGVGALGAVFRGTDRFIGYTAPSAAEAACRFCGACVEVCPTGALTDKGSKSKSGEDLLVPCRKTCPAGVDVPRYVRLVESGRYAEALAVIREKVPFPRVLGYVCAHPCEGVCRRAEVNEAVAIQSLKRFAADNAAELPVLPAAKASSGKKVAVVGAGPAGLTAAYYLSQAGHAVTVYEAMPEAGGMMRYGIPDYRLPKEILAREVAALLDRGIELKTGVRIGHEVPLTELTGAYDAVFLSIGATASRRIPVEGSDKAGVLWGIDFLRDVASGNTPTIGKKVVVIGGGNVAIDVACTARRLGAAQVDMACLESRAEMPAHSWEIEDAEEEGVVMNVSWGPKRVLGNGQVSGIELIKCTSVFDEDKRFNPKYDENNTTVLEADTVILAIGQASELGPLEGVAKTTPRGTIQVSAGVETTADGVFAAGDAVSGPASVIAAIAGGRQAAAAIDRYLDGEGDIAEVLAPVEELSPWIGRIEGFAGLRREIMPCSGAEERAKGFGLVDLGYGKEQAAAEANRCLRCDLRLMIHPVKLPPVSYLEFNEATVAEVPETEGVYELLDAEGKVLFIVGTPNLRESLEEQLSNQEDEDEDSAIGRVRYLMFEEDGMYSKRESELIQKFLGEHGRMPEGNDDLDDLF